MVLFPLSNDRTCRLHKWRISDSVIFCIISSYILITFFWLISFWRSWLQADISFLGVCWILTAWMFPISKKLWFSRSISFTRSLSLSSSVVIYHMNLLQKWCLDSVLSSELGDCVSQVLCLNKVVEKFGLYYSSGFPGLLGVNGDKNFTCIWKDFLFLVPHRRSYFVVEW